MSPLRTFLRGIWALGFVSLLMDIYLEMIHDTLPIYLVAVLGAAMTKPAFPLATAIEPIVAARFVDRVGKGIRGAAYGLRQSLDTIGALVGPLLAIALMALPAHRLAEAP